MVSLGGHLATLDPPRGPLKGPSRKNHEKVDFWSPFGRPKRSLWRPIFGNFRVFFEVFSSCFSKSFLEGFGGLWGPPPTTKTMVSCTRNHHFHISTCTPKVTRNCLQWVPFWHPLGTKMQKMVVRETSEKQVSKTVRIKSCKRMRARQAGTLWLP